MSDGDNPPMNTTDQSRAQDARRAARNVGALVVASILSKGILFGWQIVLASWLGPFENGVYTTVVALLQIGSAVASFALGVIVIRDGARYPEKLGKYWAAMLFLQTITGIIAYVGIIGGAIASGYSSAIIAYTAIAGLSLLIDSYGNISNDLLLSQERMVATSAVEIVHILVRVGLAAAALLGGFGLIGVYIATIAAGILRTIILAWLNWRRGLRPQFPVERSLSVRLLVDAAPLAITAFLVLAYGNADKLMTTAIIGETNTGYIGPAFTIHFGVIELLGTTVLTAMFPVMSRYFADDNSDTFGFIVEKMSRFTLIVVLPVALVLSIFALPIVLLLLPDTYRPTAAILQIFIWYTLITMIGNVPAHAMTIQNKQRRVMVIRVSGLLLNIALNAWLLFQFRDPRGPAIASVIAESIVVALLLTQFTANGWNWHAVRRSMWRVLLVGVIAGGTMLLVGQIHPVPGIAAGIIVYIGGIFASGALLKDDWDLIYRLTAAMPGGDIIRRYWKRDVVVNW